MKPLRTAACLLALLLPFAAIAQSAQAPRMPSEPAAATLPAWDQLTPDQREALIAPVRERWNDSPQERARMLDHARRWKTMPPEERERARRGMRRFEEMSPEQRERARAIFEQTRTMTPEQRQAFRDRWKKMSPEQRQEWLRSQPAPSKP
ncbi:DUF3106 domain-containing protein [Pseudoxanthomonas daejeonensis]|uniref:DUF3106 domain-containing protein n=1 Tax=Pseudoxanthomonas daejeonensis TaxID=266062 RepID=UPI001F540058|nr:DUF3106 domain-containing protein [Pseudoxanthomonas daejeonensis]UNK58059.1 DUF3106 domain-containing protein [Pseudoxanthomonas daejeonensis]